MVENMQTGGWHFSLAILTIQVIAADKYLIYNGFDGGLTQWLECYFHIVEVVGSNPISPTIICCAIILWGCSSAGSVEW